MSGNHTAATMQDDIRIMARRQDAMSIKLFGKTINGDGPMDIEPTPDSWCGRIATEVEQINKIATGLKERFAWGAAAIVGAGAVINLTIVIWQHYSK